jgi:hypothetical protein
MPDAPQTGIRLDDLAIDEVSGVDRPANGTDGWMVLKSRAAQLELAPEDLAAILEGALEIAREEGYDFPDTSDEADEDEDKDDEVEVKDETPAVKDETPAPVAETSAPAPAPVEPADESLVLKGLSDEARTLVLKAQADAEAATEVAKAATRELKLARDAHADREAVLKARQDWTYIPGLDPVTFGPLIRKARDSDPVFADAVSQLLTAASAALSESSLFTAAGSSTTSSGLSELDQAVMKAREAHPEFSKAQLIAEAVMSNPDLYDAYRAGQNGG